MATAQGLIQDYEGKINTLKRLNRINIQTLNYKFHSLLNLAQAYKDENRNEEVYRHLFKIY